MNAISERPKKKISMITTKTELSKHIEYNPVMGRFKRVSDGSNPITPTGRICIHGRPYSPRRLAYIMMTGNAADHKLKSENGNDADHRWSNICKHSDGYNETLNGGYPKTKMIPSTPASPPVPQPDPTRKTTLSPHRQKMLKHMIEHSDDTFSFRSASCKCSLIAAGYSFQNMESAFEEMRMKGIIEHTKNGYFKINKEVSDTILVHSRTPIIVKNIPPYPHKSNDAALIESVMFIGLGYIPGNGISWPYDFLDMKPITSLTVEYLKEVYTDIKSRIDAPQSDQEHLEWLKYLYDTMTFCGRSPEFKNK